MATDVRCPDCGEAERLRGSPSGEVIRITCEACGRTWDRDTRPSCARCGSTDLRAAPKAVMQKVRGNQMSITGTVTVHLCPVCDRDVLDKHIRSGAPLPADHPPATGS